MNSLRFFIRLLFLFSIYLNSCINRSNETLIIVESKLDTIKIDSTYSAELYLKQNNKFLPADYYILFMQDTFLLDYDHNKKCAFFNAEASSAGGKEYKGFAIFEDQGTKKMQQDFTIHFHVCR